MARTDPQINVRVEAEFKKKLEHAAIESGRSLNAEVVRRLEQSFEHQESNDIAQLKQQIERMDQTIKTLATTLQSVANRGK